MMTEHSYGVIPLRQMGAAWEILMVKHRAGHWSFPKGHPVREETPIATAKRELFEETGLVIEEVLAEKPLQERYRYRLQGKIVDKTVSYFVARVSGDVVVQEAEIAQARWFSLDQAYEVATFSEAKRLVRTVVSLLQ